MAVALIIGLWILDEVTFDTYHKNYDRIVKVWQHNLYNGEKTSQVSNPYVMAEEIRNNFGSDFTYVLQSSWNSNHILTHEDKMFNKSGSFMEPEFPEMLSLKMIKGTRNGLKDPNSILLSESLAKVYFGTSDPINQVLKVDNKLDVKVTGVYEDIPYNSSFRELEYILPWSLYLTSNTWIKDMNDPWGSNFTQTFAMLAPGSEVNQVSEKIKDVKYNKVSVEDRKYKPEVFLHPMSKWHLNGRFKNGVNTGGLIEFVWLFAGIGVFVLLLACINFMNLSTARSEKRAKEVGIRKSLGSLRTQLISQFFAESILVSLLALGVSILLVSLILPFFNQVADKRIEMPFDALWFWAGGIALSLFTGVIAGSYPALFLSSFEPVKVLKGSFISGRKGSIPRKVLVVLQFTVSVVLIIGTIVIFRQIQFAKDRPVGYSKGGLINIYLATMDVHKNFEVIRNELKTSGAIEEMTESGSPTTSTWNSNGGFNWKGKDPALAVDFPNNGCTYEYGKTVGWEIIAGRDFSRDHATDSLAFIINETTAKFLGFDEPVGEVLNWNDKPYTIIGVIRDMIVNSPYQPVRPSLFHIDLGGGNLVIIRLNRELSVKESLARIEPIFKKYNSAAPFEYEFVDEEYASKFGEEERVGKLASVFAGLAVFISCLGIFGLASYVAEQRIKEIGVRKVLGASVFNIWSMLSKEFIVLVFLSLIISIPVAYYLMYNWLLKYEYRTSISWWIFAIAGLSLVIITIATVSYQAIKAALNNPVNSLRSE